MNPVLVETFMSILILAYLVMLGAFFYHQNKGKSFVDSFDKAFESGCILFFVGYGVNASAYMMGGFA